MLLYAHSVTPRLRYVADFLTRYYNHSFIVTSNEQAYTASEDFKINYSHQRLSHDEVYIKPCPIMSESEKRKFTLHVVQHGSYKVFFETSGDLGFDIFSCIFYLLSRYEEYLPHQKDTYGRFDHTSSLAFREEFLHLPLINIWLEDFRSFLEQKFAGIELALPQFRFEPTYDIDIAWSYKHKEFKVLFGRIVQAIFTGRWGLANRIIKILKGKLQDPYDAYLWMHELHQRYNLHPVYFFLVAEQKGRFDKNISPHVPQFSKLIHDTAAAYPVGLHPSWASGDHKSLLVREKHFLEKASGRHVYASRQHYIRMSFPHTYHLLLENGITDDYSMGYGSINGFRASIATPFYWYDLEQEQTTNLLIHPFCFMDATAYHEQALTAEQAYDELMQYYHAIKAVGGTLTTIWHNHFLGTTPELEGWREMYERFVGTVAKQA